MINFICSVGNHKLCIYDSTKTKPQLTKQSTRRGVADERGDAVILIENRVGHGLKRRKRKYVTVNLIQNDFQKEHKYNFDLIITVNVFEYQSSIHIKLHSTSRLTLTVTVGK